MKISVIIPVYNAEKYVRKAVQSALQQPETAEVLLIEDCSPDNSLKKCRELEEQHEKVRLLRHPDGKNHGAGATRNLGIKNAKFDYVAFLDADDFYLPDRFSMAKELFDKNPHIDGIYEAIGVHFQDSDARRKWLLRVGDELTCVTEKVEPEQLFEALINGRKGYFHLDGLLVKKSIFEKCGYFFENLRLHQDTAMTIQMAECGILAPGRLDTAVAMRRVHGENRFLAEYDRNQTKLIFWESLFHWAQKRNVNKKRLIHLYRNYLYYSYRLKKETKPFFHNNSGYQKVLISEFLLHPFLFIGASILFLSRRLSIRGKNTL
jgi:glycosyltransferase involved in cell wall biosynthesis